MIDSGGQKGVMGASYAAARRKDPAIVYRYHTRALETVEAIRRHLPSGIPIRLLELGAADGGTMAAMAELLPAGSDFVGVEYSPELVEISRGLGPRFPVLQGDISHLADVAVKNGYDVVSALAVLEHLPAPQEAVRGASEALRTGGLFVASCPDPHWDAIADRLSLLPDHHEQRLAMRDMMALANGAGLEILETRRFMWAPAGALPYLGIRVSAKRSFAIDTGVRRMRLLDWLFVDQLVVARRR